MKNLACLAALGIALATPLAASAQPYNGSWNGPNWRQHHWMRGGHDDVTGRIASRTQSNFQLDNGRTVFLKGGTTINGTLHRGEMVHVVGSDAGNGNINADNVTVMGGYHRM